MGADEHTGSVEAAIAALARRQEGLLRRSDLEALGRGRKAIPYRVGTSRRLFALLPGITVHRTRHLAPADWRQHGLLRVTSPARTIVDEAGMLPFAALRTRVDRLRELPLGPLEQTLERSPGRQGSVAARRLLRIEQRHTKSGFERRFLAFCREHGIPSPPEVNAWVAGHKADCVYRTAWLVVELDGRAFHDRRRAFRTDRLRDTDYQLAHFRILRLTWWDLEPEWASRTAEVLRAFLSGSRVP